MAKSNVLKKAYFDWLFKEYSYSDLDKDIVKIGTPFLDNQFDYITMYAVFHKNTITLTDDGWTLHDLESHGVSFNKRNKLNNKHLTNIIASLGVDIKDNELYIKTSIEKFPVAKQRLLQAIMQVNDLIVFKKDEINTTFVEEVKGLLEQNKILHSTRPSFPGKNGITVQFDFSVPTPKKEKLIRTIRNGNDLNRSKLLTMDTQLLKYTKENAMYYAIFDDENYPLNKSNEIQAIFDENASSEILSLLFTDLQNNPEILSNTA